MYTFSLDFVMFKQRFPNKNIFLRLSLEVWAWRVIKGKNAEEVDEGKGYNGRNVEEGKERNRKWKKEGFKGRNEIQSGNETKKEDIKGGKGRKKEWHRSKEGKGTEDTKEDRKASKEGRNPKIGKNRRKEKRRYSEDGRDAPPLPPNKYFGISKKKTVLVWIPKAESIVELALQRGLPSKITADSKPRLAPDYSFWSPTTQLITLDSYRFIVLRGKTHLSPTHFYLSFCGFWIFDCQ